MDKVHPFSSFLVFFFTRELVHRYSPCKLAGLPATQYFGPCWNLKNWRLVENIQLSTGSTFVGMFDSNISSVIQSNWLRLTKVYLPEENTTDGMGFWRLWSSQNKGIFYSCSSRDTTRVIPIIQQWIAPGTTIHSDMWGAYNQLMNIGYQHGTVNHTYHFVDPLTGIYTNHFEWMWMWAKNKLKAHNGPTNQDVIANYLVEFIWVQRFG